MRLIHVVPTAYLDPAIFFAYNLLHCARTWVTLLHLHLLQVSEANRPREFI